VASEPSFLERAEDCRCQHQNSSSRSAHSKGAHAYPKAAQPGLANYRPANLINSYNFLTYLIIVRIVVKRKQNCFVAQAGVIAIRTAIAQPFMEGGFNPDVLRVYKVFERNLLGRGYQLRHREFVRR
jgi:hypothetical protein